jgi:hypothetical protein
VAARTIPVPTEADLKNGVPLFLSQLIDRLRLATIDNGAIEESAAQHGGELLAMGFTVSQVVHGYGDVCQVITQLADETGAPISADEFQAFHRCLDEAMAHSVTEYQRRRDESVASEGTERLGVLAHALRNRLSDAMLASTLLQKGTVAIGGSTGAVLGRSLRGMRNLVTSALDGVRLESGPGAPHPVAGSELGGAAEIAASGGADVGSAALAVSPDIDVSDG